VTVTELERVLSLMKSFKVSTLKFLGAEIVLAPDYAPDTKPANEIIPRRARTIDDDPFTYGGPDSDVPGYTRES